MQDVIINGVGYGPVGEVLTSREVALDMGRLRPFMAKGKNGGLIPAVTINTGRYVRDDKAPGGKRPEVKTFAIEELARRGIYIPVANAVSLRRDDYVQIDRVITEVARKNQVVANDIEGFGVISVPGMSKETYEREVISDYGVVQVDMDGLTAGIDDGPLITRDSQPLPIAHVDFTTSQRRLNTFGSANGGPDLNSLNLKMAGIRLGENLEQRCLGTLNLGLAYGTNTSGPNAQRSTTGAGNAILSKEYGLTTHPARLTKTNMTAPTGGNPNTTYQEVLGVVQTMLDYNFRGPWNLYYSTDWSQYMAGPYAYTNGSNWAVNPTKTLKDALLSIEGIQSVKRVDWLPATTNPFTLLLVTASGTVVEMVVGMGVTTVMWPSKGGLQQNTKTLMIKTPSFHFDYNGYLPVYHMTTS